VATIGMDMEGYKVQPPHHSLERITYLAFSPHNVHETGVSPGGQSGCPLVAGRRSRSIDSKKELVTGRFEVFCAVMMWPEGSTSPI
jgi:hypothetical protein